MRSCAVCWPAASRPRPSTSGVGATPAEARAPAKARYIDWLTIDDNASSVVEDVARIRNHPLVNKSIPIYGYIYDVKSGRLIEVPEASAVGSAASAPRQKSSQGGQGFDQRAKGKSRYDQGTEACQSDGGCCEQNAQARQSDQSRQDWRAEVRQDQSGPATKGPVFGVGSTGRRAWHSSAPHKAACPACARARQTPTHATGAPEGAKPSPAHVVEPATSRTFMATPKAGASSSTSMIQPCHLLFGQGHPVVRSEEHHGTRRGQAPARQPASNFTRSRGTRPLVPELIAARGDSGPARARDRPEGRHLAELEALYRTADAGLALLDRELRYVRLNERLAAMNGVPLEAHLGRTVREVVPDLADDAEAAFGQVFETGEPISGWQLEGETAHQRGIVRRWSEDIIPIKRCDGSVRPAWSSSGRSVTSVPRRPWQRWPRSWNPRTRRSRARPWTASSRAGTPPPRRCSVTPPPRSSAATSRFSAAPGREDEMPAILERIRRGEKVERYETVRRRKDGSLVEIALTVSPIRDESGASSAPRRSPATSPSRSG